MPYICQICRRRASYVKPNQKHHKRRGRRLGGNIQHDVCGRCWQKLNESANVQWREERIAAELSAA